MKQTIGAFVMACVMSGVLFHYRYAVWGWMERARLRWEGSLSACVPAGLGHGCVDYNGPWGNEDPRARGWQRWVNFLGSDCCMALLHGYCWDEFITHEPCVHNHHGKDCSVLIGLRSEPPTSDTRQRPPATRRQPPRAAR